MKFKFLVFFITFVSVLHPIKSIALQYDWKNDVSWLVTRCFDANNVNAKCDETPDVRIGSPEDLSELQIRATGFGGQNFFYSYEKAIPSSTCKMHLRRIKEISKSVKNICITGRGENIVNSESEISSQWYAVETSRGKVIW